MSEKSRTPNSQYDLPEELIGSFSRWRQEGDPTKNSNRHTVLVRRVEEGESGGKMRVFAESYPKADIQLDRVEERVKQVAISREAFTERYESPVLVDESDQVLSDHESAPNPDWRRLPRDRGFEPGDSSRTADSYSASVDMSVEGKTLYWSAGSIDSSDPNRTPYSPTEKVEKEGGRMARLRNGVGAAASNFFQKLPGRGGEVKPAQPERVVSRREAAGRTLGAFVIAIAMSAPDFGIRHKSGDSAAGEYDPSEPPIVREAREGEGSHLFSLEEEFASPVATAVAKPTPEAPAVTASESSVSAAAVVSEEEPSSTTNTDSGERDLLYDTNGDGVHDDLDILQPQTPSADYVSETPESALEHIDTLTIHSGYGFTHLLQQYRPDLSAEDSYRLFGHLVEEFKGIENVFELNDGATILESPGEDPRIEGTGTARFAPGVQKVIDEWTPGQ